MGKYTDFHLATDEELRRAFFGWKRPRTDRVERSVPNPFTRQPMTVLRWVPDPEDARTCEPFPGKTLGERLTHLPCLELKNLDPLMLGDLVAIVSGDEKWRERFVDETDPPPLVGPEDGELNILAELPESFLEAMVAATDDDLRRHATEWSTCELNEWSAEECEEVLVDLRALAVRGRRERRRLFYWY